MFACMFAALSLLVGCGKSSQISFGTDTFSYTIDSTGKNVSFIDLKTGTNHLVADAPSYCAAVTLKDGTKLNPSKAAFDGSVLSLTFGDAGIKAAVAVESKGSCVVFKVGSIDGPDVVRLDFITVPLDVSTKPDAPFAACSIALTEATYVEQLPALQSKLQAGGFARFGIAGTKAAIIALPASSMLEAIRAALENNAEFTFIKTAGAWADETPFNHGSYLFNFGDLTEKTVDDWITTVQSLGFNQIDNHGGSAAFFRFGDFVLNSEKYPDGWNTYANIVQKLHDAGINSIFHTYTFFIDKHSKYVTPVPHPELGSFRSFELASDIGEKDTEIAVSESTADVSTITGFFVRNSVTLHIGDELVTFSGVTKEPPYKFTGCVRGAYGTTPSAHAKGSKARHLKECFGLFCPDPETGLFEEIAKNHADVINQCKFDGFYLDAIDGSDILAGPENAWYYGQKFVFDIYKYLDKERPVSMEMSAMWHQMWNFRSRWQAWDYPNRGQKRFIDIHAQSVNGSLLMPLHLGWWNFQTFNPPQVEPSYTDVIEYVGCKLIGYNAGLSLTGAVNKENLQKIPAYRKLVNLLKQYEDLRHAGYFDESVRSRLREPGKDFTLIKDDSGAWRFKPASYSLHKVEGNEHPTSKWTVANEFASQPASFRIEALMSAGPYDAKGNITLADFSDASQQVSPKSETGVEASIAPDAANEVAGNRAGKLTAKNSGAVKQNGAWMRFDRAFDPELDLVNHQALGVWINGDGNGELLNIRLESPEHIAYGAVADHYVTIDFTGWRYFELIETESARWNDYTWKDGKGMYNVYRELIDFKHVDKCGIWLNNLPPNKDVACSISPVKALPMVANTITDPALTIGDKTVVFPCKMESGDYLECYSPADCILYDRNGNVRAKVAPRGDLPELRTGDNQVSFTCSGKKGLNPRVKVTVIGYGEPF